MNSNEYKKWLKETSEFEKDKLRKEMESVKFYGTMLDWLNLKK